MRGVRPSQTSYPRLTMIREITTRARLGLYPKTSFGHRIGFGKRPAILVVDLTPAFADPDASLGCDLRRVEESSRRLLDCARMSSVPIVFAVTAYHNSRREAGWWLAKIPALAQLKFGLPQTVPVAGLGRRPDEPIVVKRYASAFFGTQLRSMLTSNCVDTIIIIGCTTSGCVRATAVDAMQNGFRPVVVRECVGDRLRSAHRASLRDLDAKYCDVVSLREVVDVISSARSPERRCRRRFQHMEPLVRNPAICAKKETPK